jgi:tetratricopeptide (TPR) repeat protein
MPANATDRWTRIKTLFEAAASLGAGAREALFSTSGLSEEDLAELRSLLAHHDQATGGSDFLSQSAVPPEPGRAGQRLGAWQIVRKLGSGGMGEVFEARRADGSFEGRAAVKLLKRGMDSAAVLARFAQERQALARLNHPHIARLLDAGASEDGLPYFVLEYVDGQAIDVAARGLALEARLRLFLQLADAVAHAHRNLLVHRDLKPGNVLVDGEGQVKLLDFGIAKALDPLEDADGGHTTVGGVRPYTPHYASPEQVRGEPVSTATDIYSLGVLLYVMLTGQRPYGRAATTPADAARSVLEEVPTRPSSVPTPEPGWEATRRALQGDLDNILLKALEKPPERRYGSVDALAADVRAYLGGYPVTARPASPAYVAAKFLRRHRWAVLAGGLGGLGLATGLAAALLQGQVAAALGAAGLAAGLSVALLQARQAAVARDEARGQLQGVKQMATELLFRFGDTLRQLPGGAPAQEALLKELMQTLELPLRHAPGDAELVMLAAAALGRLAELQANPSFAGPGRAQEAQATVARALALGEEVWAAKHGDARFAHPHLVTLLAQAQLLRLEGRPGDGVQVLQRAVERCGQVLAAGQPDDARAQLLELRANLWISLAQYHFHAGRPDINQPEQALAHYETAEAELRALYGTPALVAALDRATLPGDPGAAAWGRHHQANVHTGRGLVHQRRGEFAALKASVERALALRLPNLQAQPQFVTWRQTVMFDRHTLALAELGLGDAAAALAALQLAWAEAEALQAESGPEGPWAATLEQFAGAKARALHGCGRSAEALPLFERALAQLAVLRQRADTPALQEREALLRNAQQEAARAAAG